MAVTLRLCSSFIYEVPCRYGCHARKTLHLDNHSAALYIEQATSSSHDGHSKIPEGVSAMPSFTEFESELRPDGKCLWAILPYLLHNFVQHWSLRSSYFTTVLEGSRTVKTSSRIELNPHFYQLTNTRSPPRLPGCRRHICTPTIGHLSSCSYTWLQHCPTCLHNYARAGEQGTI